MQIGMIGSGSWATALTKILTDNGQTVHWWVRNESYIKHIQLRHHNPHYLSAAYFDTNKLILSTDIQSVIKAAEVLVVAVPSAYIIEAVKELPADIFANKKIISAIKGVIPSTNQLLNEYLSEQFNFNADNYFTVLGPCHAEEVAAEKLSYLTFSGTDETMAKTLADFFKTDYLNTVTNNDIAGVQYAAILKNIYALGAGIAHGLEYGDNFLSVYIANSANEMVGFLKKLPQTSQSGTINYAASVYLGDLLVTCYSLFSRNRTFGNMIGKGYSVQAAQLEMNMVAEGYNASKCMHRINQTIQADMPIATTIYEILWKNLQAEAGFKKIETYLA